MLKISKSDYKMLNERWDNLHNYYDYFMNQKKQYMKLEYDPFWSIDARKKLRIIDQNIYNIQIDIKKLGILLDFNEKSVDI